MQLSVCAKRNANKLIATEVARKKFVRLKRRSRTNSGDNGVGEPPVLIPNTEVKTYIAESTWLDTAREDMTPPDSTKRRKQTACVFFYTLIYIPSKYLINWLILNPYINP